MKLSQFNGVLIGVLCHLANGLNDDSIGKRPPMGWNSWNHFGCNVNETLIQETIDAIAADFAAFGYEYVNVDDCWQLEERDSDTGKVIPDPKTFGKGMKALADYAHSRKLKFGLYSDAGTATCMGRAGSLGYEAIDAETYASWGIDFLKYDNCHNRNLDPRDRYRAMNEALVDTAHPIFFSMCEWGEDNAPKWAHQYADSWRTTKDIRPNWPRIKFLTAKNDRWWRFAGPSKGWNDPDMLEVGNAGITPVEAQSHFSLWSLMKAPLIIGLDARGLKHRDPTSYAILTNSDAIAINQDALGEQGRRVARLNGRKIEVWSGKLSSDPNTQARRWALLILNNSPNTNATVTVNWALAKLPQDVHFDIYDINAHQFVTDNVKVEDGLKATDILPHGVKFYRISEQLALT